jgi:hypothetical protein
MRAIFLLLCVVSSLLANTEQFPNFNIPFIPIPSTPIPPVTPPGAPFTIRPQFLNETLGVEVQLDMNSALKNLGIKDIYLGVQFPLCSRTFQIYVDMKRSWTGPIAKVYTKEMTVAIPRLCLNDLGISIPLTQICFTVKDLSIMARGIVGTLVADLTVSAAIVQYKEDDIELVRFSMGQVTDCFRYKTQAECVKSQNASTVCGWCSETNQCLEARPDRKADVCKFCHRCNYFLTMDKMKDECLNKLSCGWCEKSSQCFGGDDLGPFHGSCEGNVTTSSITSGTQAWQFSQISTANSNANAAAVEAAENQGKASTALAAVFGTLCGILFGGVVVAIILIIPTLVFLHKKQLSVKEYFTVLFAKK